MSGAHNRNVFCLSALLAMTPIMVFPGALSADDDLPQPHACTCNITGATAVCIGNNITLTAVTTGINGPTYTWSQILGTGTVSFGTPNAVSTTVTGLTAGTVRVKCLIVDDGTGGCTDCGPTLDIVVNANPACTISGPDPVCSGTTNNYSGTAGMATYSWSIAGNGSIVGLASDPSVSVLAGAAGSYTLSLTIVDANGCTSNCDKIVTVAPLPNVNITHNAGGDLCPNWAGYVASVPAITCVPVVPGFPIYAWSISAGGTIVGPSNQASVSFKVDTSNPTVTLSVTVTGCNGCSDSNSVVFNVCQLAICQTGQLRLQGPMVNVCYKYNDMYTIGVYMDNVSCPTAGFQAFLSYNSARLQYIGAGSSYTSPLPFGLVTIPINDTIGSLNHPALGKVNLSSGVNVIGGQLPVTGTNIHLATLQFKVISNDGCDGVYVDFRPDPAGVGDGPRPPTRLTDLAGFGFGTITQVPVSVAGLVVVPPASIRIDGTAPVAVSSGPIASCYPTQAAAMTAAMTNSSATDNCTGPLTPTVTPTPDGCTLDIFVDYTDGCGNISNFLHYVTRVDNTPPVITCPANAAIQCSDSTLPANTGTATATDNCPGAINITYADVSSPTLVNPGNPNGWTIFATTSLTNTPGGDGTADYVVGPPVPPLGVGSAHLNTGTDGSQSAQMRNASWAGTRIDALTALGYSTYATAWNGQQLPYLTIYLDTDNDNVRDDRLWFEPDYSGPGFGGSQPATALNVWQTWDALAGKWYSDSGVGTPGAGAVTLAVYLAAKPNATIINDGANGGIRIASGFASAGDVFNAYVDAFVIQTATSGTTYNFELAGCANYTITRTWTAADFCGNSASCVQTIQVSDTTGPVITCPPNATVECSDSIDPNLIGAPTVNTFSVAPVLSPTQAPGVWYTDRYAPAGFVSASFLGDDRLKHTIDAADCETCRPLPYQSAFYNTQGRKYDISGSTQMSIQLYVPSAWASTGRRMAGFWGTGFDSLAATASYPIIEFSSNSEGSGLPRFRGWDNGLGWIDMGLPAGFVYDAWYTLKIELVGANWRYTVGDLQLVTPAFGAVEIENVILQGHNNLAGVTYDIHWDNFSTTAPLPATAIDNCDPAPVITSTDDLTGLTGCDGTGVVLRTWHALDACGNETTCVQTITVVDTTAPIITCAANVVVNPSLSELADCDADNVTIVAPTAFDNCDVTVTPVGIRSDTLAVVTPGLNSFPPGVTTITWTATDDCLNASQCLQTVTVNAASISVAVELSPTIAPLPLNRCITFEVFDCVNASQTISQVMTFNNVLGRALANDTICVPLNLVTCVTARDTLHTLRSRVDNGLGGGLTGSAPAYAADFTGKRVDEPPMIPVTPGSGHRLVGGNLNDDEYIDILDFGTWAGAYNVNYGTGDTTCSTVAPHADITGNGLVDSGDFSFIAINFLMFREANCCGLLNITAPSNGGDLNPASPLGVADKANPGPLTRISVEDLRARRLDNLIAGDINRDGWLDMNDVMLAWIGLPPAALPVPAGSVEGQLIPIQTEGAGANGATLPPVGSNPPLKRKR